MINILSRHLEKQPAQKWHEAELKEWLDSEGELFVAVIWLNQCITEMCYPDNALKKDLWEIVKQSRTPPKYATDQMAKEKDVCA